MKRFLFIVLSLFILLTIVACPTPFGIIYADRILHWDGTDETIEDWLGGDDEDMAEVAIAVQWPGDEAD